MKKFLIKVLFFFVVIALLDVLSGFGFKALQKRAIGGDSRRNEYINNEMMADIVLLGSSHCLRHYDPRVFERVLGLSAYNAGMRGNGILLMYPRFRMIVERYNPKVIVYELTASFDLLKDDNERYLHWSRPYYGKNGVDSVFWSVNPMERIKMKSYLYRYNSYLFQLVGDNFNGKKQYVKGFLPGKGELTYDPPKSKKSSVVQYDSLKIDYLRKIINDCKRRSIILVFTVSPMYEASDSKTFEPAKKLAQENGIPFFDHLTDSRFNNKKNLYFDSTHMNAKGAMLYSEVIAAQIRTVCKNFLGRSSRNEI